MREILDQYKSSAEIFLGGAPMITVDMIDYIQNDIEGIRIIDFDIPCDSTFGHI